MTGEPGEEEEDEENSRFCLIHIGNLLCIFDLGRSEIKVLDATSFEDISSQEWQIEALQVCVCVDIT
nr:hypothetical protein [Tanacetum cinerariifolium]